MGASSIGFPESKVSKHLVTILSPLQNNKYSVKNSRVFVDRIRKHMLNPDEIFVSFNFVSLFTSISTFVAVKITK